LLQPSQKKQGAEVVRGGTGGVGDVALLFGCPQVMLALLGSFFDPSHRCEVSGGLPLFDGPAFVHFSFSFVLLKTFSSTRRNIANIC
jgi:hypothetical protein